MSRAHAAGLVFDLVMLMGCDPCWDLDERICSDLGDDCQVWRTDLSALRASYLSENDRRLTSRWRTCSALADEPDYSARLLPSVRNAVARLRDPHAAQLPVATGAPSSSGGGPWMLLPLLAAAGYFVYYKVTVPKRRAEASARVDHLSDAQARALEELRAQRDQGEHKDS